MFMFYIVLYVFCYVYPRMVNTVTAIVKRRCDGFTSTIEVLAQAEEEFRHDAKMRDLLAFRLASIGLSTDDTRI